MKINFIVAQLGDNDFGHILKDGLLDLIEQAGGNITFCPILAKKYLIEYIIARRHLRNILVGGYDDLNELRRYLSRLRVSFCKSLPTYTPYDTKIVDDDGGSAYFDVNLKQCNTF